MNALKYEISMEAKEELYKYKVSCIIRKLIETKNFTKEEIENIEEVLLVPYREHHILHDFVNNENILYIIKKLYQII